MIEDLERRLRDLAAVELELSNESLALAERHAMHHDELEKLADHVYADGQDELALVLLRQGDQ